MRREPVLHKIMFCYNKARYGSLQGWPSARRTDIASSYRPAESGERLQFPSSNRRDWILNIILVPGSSGTERNLTHRCAPLTVHEWGGAGLLQWPSIWPSRWDGRVSGPPRSKSPGKGGIVLDYLPAISSARAGSSVMIPSTPASITLRISASSLTVQVKTR